MLITFRFLDNKDFKEAQEALKRTAPYPNCHLIKKNSAEAVNDFPKYSLDFVYIDGSHEFGHIAMDLHLWTSRVKKGGIIAGHDYYSTTGNRGLRQVGMVVDAFVEANDFDSFWVLGTKDDYKDMSLSYFMIKHW